MSDLISRQAAIDLLKQMRKDGDMVPWEGKDVFARIRKLPPAHPEQRWIPVSDRLPKQGQEVICQCRANIIKVLKLDADGDWYQDAKHCYMYGFVIAWMPLPEPYKDDPCNGCDYLGESCVGEGCGKLTERKEGEAE